MSKEETKRMTDKTGINQKKNNRNKFFNKIRRYYSTFKSAPNNEQFHDIPVDINGVTQLFNFELLKDEDGRLWIANSKMQTLYIDEDFNYDNFSMPKEWIEPAINKLKALLQDDEKE